MLKHNLLIAFRNFKKYKSNFLINIVGLTTSLACVLFVYLWVTDEKSVDKFHENEENIYQVISNLDLGDGNILTLTNNPLLMTGSIVDEIPEVIDAAAINANFMTPKGIFKDGENTQAATGLFATPNFFEMFSFDLIYGDKSLVLANKYNVVLSEDLAKKLYGNPENAIGKTLNWDYQWSDGNAKENVVVSGVFKNLPANSTIQFEAVVNTDLMVDADRWAGDWSGGYAQVFLKLQEGTNIDKFNQKIRSYNSDKRGDKFKFVTFVQKFSDRYLYSPYEDGIQVGGRHVYVRLFTIIALFILAIACINFTNLSTVQATKRMKEIGVKKAIGANRKSLIFQFLQETIFMALFSLLFAIVIVVVLLPLFNTMVGKELSLHLDIPVIINLIMLVLLTGIFAGFYPAIYLSRFKPVSILKGKSSGMKGEEWVRKGLVVFQFAICIVFILGVLIIHKQIEFTQSKNLGYNRDNIVRFEMASNNKNPLIFLDEISKLPNVKNSSFMSGDFLDGLDNNGGWSWSGQESEAKILFQSPRMGYNAIETLGMEVLMGRTFSKEHNDNFNKVIINESALKLMQLKDPIGYMLQKGEVQQEIVGVVKDFQYGSIHKKIEPLIIRFRDGGRNAMIKISSGTERETLTQMEEIYKKFHPGYSFNYSFLNHDYTALYNSENRVADLSNYFAILAVLISCLGLFGLAAFTAEKRSKEIGIRKILGSSNLSIIKMLSTEFTKIVFIAILIALPIGYWISSIWLENFGYAIDLKWWFFALSGCSAFLIALLTVGWQCLKAAKTNPVKSLRTE